MELADVECIVIGAVIVAQGVAAAEGQAEVRRRRHRNPLHHKVGRVRAEEDHIRTRSVGIGPGIRQTRIADRSALTRIPYRRSARSFLRIIGVLVGIGPRTRYLHRSEGLVVNLIPDRRRRAAIQIDHLTAVTGLQRNVIQSVNGTYIGRETHVKFRNGRVEREVRGAEDPIWGCRVTVVLRIGNLLPVRTVGTERHMEFLGVEDVIVAAVVVLERIAATERQPKIGLRRGEFDLVNGERSGSAAEEDHVRTGGTVVGADIRKTRITDRSVLSGIGYAFNSGTGGIPTLILIGIRPRRGYFGIPDGGMENGFGRNNRTLRNLNLLGFQVAVGVVDRKGQLGALAFGGGGYADLNGRIALAAGRLDSHPLGGFLAHSDPPGPVRLDREAAIALLRFAVLVESQRGRRDFQVRSSGVFVVIDTARESRSSNHRNHAEQQLKKITLSHSI